MALLLLPWLVLSSVVTQPAVSLSLLPPSSFGGCASHGNVPNHLPPANAGMAGSGPPRRKEKKKKFNIPGETDKNILVPCIRRHTPCSYISRARLIQTARHLRHCGARGEEASRDMHHPCRIREIRTVAPSNHICWRLIQRN